MGILHITHITHIDSAARLASAASADAPLHRWRSPQTNRPSFNTLLFRARCTPPRTAPCQRIRSSSFSYFVISREEALRSEPHAGLANDARPST